MGHTPGPPLPLRPSLRAGVHAACVHTRVRAVTGWKGSALRRSIAVRVPGLGSRSPRVPPPAFLWTFRGMGVGGGGHAAPEPRAVAGAEGCARPRAPPPASPPGKGWGQGRGSSPGQGFAAKRPHPHRFCSLQAPRSHFCGRGAGQVLFLGQVSEARWPGLGGRPLGEEPGASEVRGVKGAGGRRRLCGRGVGAWPSGPRTCAMGARPASPGAARPPAHPVPSQAL